jgi:hypothetical protein
MTRRTLLIGLAALACGPKLPPSTWPVETEKRSPPSGDEWLALIGAPWNDSSVRDAVRRAGGASRNGMYYDGKSQYLKTHRVILSWRAHPGRQPAGFPDDVLLLTEIDFSGDYRGGFPLGLDPKDRAKVQAISGERLDDPYFPTDTALMHGPGWIVQVTLGDRGFISIQLN